MKRYHIINDKNEEVFDPELFNEAIKDGSVITINSVSGGQTSAYIMANYPADYNVFSLVRTSDPKCMFPDAKLRQIVSDKIGKEFIGTLEEDEIIYTMLDLEQYTGHKINWVSGQTFDEVIKYKGNYLPNKVTRFCTTHLKLIPIFEWWHQKIGVPFEMRIGYRANEQRRAKVMIEKLNDNGLLELKHTMKKRPDGRNHWETFEWQKPSFPLINDMIFKDTIHNFWKEKPVRFAYMNNCVGCFHRSEILLNKMFDWHPSKMQWFADQEKREKAGSWKTGTTYEKIGKHFLQTDLGFDDFNECDSGYCGL